MKTPSYLSFALLLGAALFTQPSCSVLRTVDAPVGTPNTGRAYAGLHYFLPRAILTMTGVQGTGDDYTVTVTASMKADKADRYRLVPSVNGLYDDAANFSVNSDGLINGAVVNSSLPRLADIVRTLGETAVLVGRIVIKLNSPLGAPTARSKEATTTRLDRFTVSFDPFDPVDVRNAIRQVDNAGLRLEVLNGYDGRGNAKGGNSESSLPLKGTSMQGVVYRPQTTVKMRLTAHNDRKENVAHTFIASVPDPNSIATYSLARSVLAAKKNIPTFVNGVLTSIDYSYESEVLATARFAKGVAEQALGIIDNSPDVVGLIYKPRAPVDPNADLNSEIRQLEREKTRINLQNEIIRKRRENDDLKNSVGASDSPTARSNSPMGFRAPEKISPAPLARQRNDNPGRSGFDDLELPERAPRPTVPTKKPASFPPLPGAPLEIPQPPEGPK